MSIKKTSGRQPNILFIVTDQQHADSMSALGNRFLNTPGLDRLMERGTTFTRNYCTYPLCSPGRSSIYSGRMASETGVYENGLHIREDVPNMGQWFSKHTDYEVLYAGKWHVAIPHTIDIPGFRVICPGMNCQGVASDFSVSMACEAYLRNRTPGKPFLLAVNFTQPHDIGAWVSYHRHDPGDVLYPEIVSELPDLPDNFEVNFEEPERMRGSREKNVPNNHKWGASQWQFYRWAYFRMVEMVDKEIQRVLQALEASEDLTETLVVFTSDHGEGLAHHQRVTKGFLYDEACRVPLIVSWLGMLPEGRRDDETLISGCDLMPTVCDYAGIEPPRPMSGISLRGLLEESQAPDRDFVVVEAYHGQGQALRSRCYKYIAFNDDPAELFFDMNEDPGETRNLAGQSEHADVLAEHRQWLKVWNHGLDVAPTVPEEYRWA